MHRLPRSLLNLAALLSLATCLAIALLWARSYVDFLWPRSHPISGLWKVHPTRATGLALSKGRLYLRILVLDDPAFRPPYGWTCAHDPPIDYPGWGGIPTHKHNWARAGFGYRDFQGGGQHVRELALPIGFVLLMLPTPLLLRCLLWSIDRRRARCAKRTTNAHHPNSQK